jgi:multiple sugar transport system permease protein
MIVMVGPFVWMILGSIKTQRELLQVPPTWLPADPTLSNYDRLFDRLDFPRFFWNSTLVAVAITAANVVFCSMTGYALAKLRFAGRNLLFLLVLGTLLVPGSVTLVPLFVLMSRLELVNTLWAVILPAAAGPLGVFLMRQFMLAIPDDLLEAARVDGAGEWTIFWRIVMPLSAPAVAALAIITFLPAWNALLWPLVVLTSEEKYTLPVALAIFARGQFQADYGLLMAGSVVLVLPVIVLFFVLQRHFTQSVAMTGVKG